jgi:hypothetical protein
MMELEVARPDLLQLAVFNERRIETYIKNWMEKRD